MHNTPVLHARWNPIRKGNLAVCCGTRSIYTWSDEWVSENGSEEEMAECIGVPASMSYFECIFFPWPRLIATLTEKFETRDLKWAPDGKGLILMDKDVFCCAFEVEEEEPPAEA